MISGKKALAAAALIAMTMGGIGSANASCGVWGKIVYSTQSATGGSWYYVAPKTSFPTYYYSFYTTSDNIKKSLNSAMSGDESAYVYSYSATATCPTTGTIRNAGTATVASVSENY